ncbi:S-formylglutathione hydrolase FrmB, partial [Sesbania bispinosa]
DREEFDKYQTVEKPSLVDNHKIEYPSGYSNKRLGNETLHAKYQDFLGEHLESHRQMDE